MLNDFSGIGVFSTTEEIVVSKQHRVLPYLSRYISPRQAEEFINKLEEAINEDNEAVRESRQKAASSHSRFFVLTMAYINYEIEKERAENEKRKAEKKGAKASGSVFIETDDGSLLPVSSPKPTTKITAFDKKNVIIIGGITIEKGEGSKITRSKIFTRKCPAWGVRGHERHYNDGRVVRIKPYTKGPKRKEIEAKPKIYKMKETETTDS